MMKIQLVVFLIAFSFYSTGQEHWKKMAIKPKPFVCYASHDVHKVFVKPVPLKSASIQKSNITVDYIGFPEDAKAAFQYAVDLWAGLIYSPIPIHVKATWESLASDVLGSCAPTNYYTDFESTQVWNCYYPVALVEKMLGKNINSTDYELEASFNKDFTNWYFRTDGNTPTNKYDFVSTVLHEFAHGIGFHGFFYTDIRSRGAYGRNDGFPAAFDLFVQNKAGQKLINTTVFANPSTLLYQNFTSGWLTFNSPLNELDLPRLYAPTTWDGGSSIYHLNDATYPAGSPDALMTHAQSMGEADFDPGPKAMAILNDIGWKSVLIKHNQLKDIEFVTAPVSFNAEIASDFDLDSTKVYLIYSSNNFQKTDSVALKYSSTTGQFTTLLTPVQNATFKYYFSAKDIKKRTFVFPSNSPTRYFSFTTGIDKTAPVIVHEPINYILSANPSLKLEATVTDNIGVKSVKVEYFVNGGTIKQMALVNDSTDHYSGILSFPAGIIQGGDLISYRIVATDLSSQGNVGQSPENGYNTVKVEGVKDPVDRYITDFNSSNQDFIGSDFTIATPTGFDNAALNSAHPYLSPDADNTTFNFTSILRYPIVLNATGKMTFDEIALVEPGESGSKFGDENFWDYVIIEGSSDNGVTWKPLADGWDSNLQASWLAKWNSSFSGNNSTAVATKDLYVEHAINMLANGNFKTGDTILIRFRLFSDPYSHGWGWIIDNLAIQDVGTGVSRQMLSSGEVLFYPNPANDNITVSLNSQKSVKTVQLKAYKTSGERVYNRLFAVESNSFETKIDVTQFVPGLYLFVVETEDGQTITRKVVVQ
jgi:hypothetical protein